jgi:hypothetical protein
MRDEVMVISESHQISARELRFLELEVSFKTMVTLRGEPTGVERAK